MTEVAAIGRSPFTMISGPTQVPTERRSDVFAFNLNGCVKPLSRENTIGNRHLGQRESHEVSWDVCKRVKTKFMDME